MDQRQKIYLGLDGESPARQRKLKIVSLASVGCKVSKAGRRIETWGHSPSRPKDVYCLPDGVDAEQVGLIIAKFAEQHPELLHNDAGMGLGVILSRDFPCATK